MAHQKKRLYASIEKVEDQDDGTVKVWGYASTGDQDSDGEIVTPDAMKAALPDYMKFGAVREMHQSSAAGTAIEAEVQDTGKTWFGAHIVDPVAVKKVQTGVYKGFSIGGKVTERDTADRKIIKGLNLIEVSLVDRPANPNAVFTMYKAAGTPADDIDALAELLDAGAVTPGQLLAYAGELQKSAEADSIKKGMYQLEMFASVLQSVGYLVSDTAWDAEYEGDNSPLPAALFAWFKQGVDLFRQLTIEETEELVADLQTRVGAQDEVSLAEKAADADDLQKRGARFSKSTKAALKAAHDACKAADTALAALKYEDAEDEPEDEPAADPADEPAADPADAPAKAASVSDTDGTALRKSLEDALARIEKAEQELDTLRKTAAPGKALLKSFKGSPTATTAVSKSEDVDTDNELAPTEAAPPEGTPERAAYEMRKVFASARV